MKTCSKCGESKTLEEFSFCKKNGTQRYCKNCRSKYAKDNREKINEQARVWYAIKSWDYKTLGKRVQFRRTKVYQLLKYHGMCACGAREDLCVHHKDENPLNNKVTNLEIMCRPCHSRFHAKKHSNVSSAHAQREGSGGS